MTIELTTPAEGGVIADGETFTHMRIAHFSMDVTAKRICFVLLYGTKVDGKFIRSSHKKLKQEIVIKGGDYSTLVAGASAIAVGQNLFKGVQDTLEQWLMAYGYGAGVIE